MRRRAKVHEAWRPCDVDNINGLLRLFSDRRICGPLPWLLLGYGSGPARGARVVGQTVADRRRSVGSHSGQRRRLLRKLNDGLSSGVPPFKYTPARSSTLRARSWYFTARAFSRSDTDRYPPNFANSSHLRDIALSRAAVAIASRWGVVRAIDALGTALLIDPQSRKWSFAQFDALSTFGRRESGPQQARPKT